MRFSTEGDPPVQRAPAGVLGLPADARTRTPLSLTRIHYFRDEVQFRRIGLRGVVGSVLIVTFFDEGGLSSSGISQ